MEHRDYSGAIRFLTEHSVRVPVIARLFGKAESSIPVIVWRAANRVIPQSAESVLLDLNITGTDADQLLEGAKVDESEIAHLYNATDLEERIDAFGAQFWQKVKDRKGARELGLLLRKVSRPSVENLPLRRQAAKLYHLLAELHLHAGYCRSALVFARRAYQAESELYRETLSRGELFRIGKTCLLISQALINRSEYKSALPWLRRSKQAFASGSHKLDPEYFKQLGNIQFHENAPDSASKNFREAARLLPDYERTPTVAQIKDIGERHLNLIGDRPNWERSLELMEYALASWPKDDIHKSLNVNWTAAAGLMTDSHEANKKAIDLLHSYGYLSKGYQHPATVTRLLLMTPELPKGIRGEWVRFSLHYNAYRNK
jgi:tetratricopeptide (TPR) repeat protein